MSKYDLGEVIKLSGPSKGYGIIILVGGFPYPIHKNSRKVFLENGQICISGIENMKRVRVSDKKHNLEIKLLELFKEKYPLLYKNFIEESEKTIS